MSSESRFPVTGVMFHEGHLLFGFVMHCSSVWRLRAIPDMSCVRIRNAQDSILTTHPGLDGFLTQSGSKEGHTNLYVSHPSSTSLPRRWIDRTLPESPHWLMCPIVIVAHEYCSVKHESGVPRAGNGEGGAGHTRD